MTIAFARGGSSQRSYRPVVPSPLTFHLLEVTLISAQDLHPANLWMQAYAVAWVQRDRKLRTRIDPCGGINPHWNDKFVFRVDDAFLRSDTSAVTIDIFSSRTLRPDCLIGTVRMVISSLNPSPATSFVALMVRRPKSLRPQGIMNIGVALVDAYIHSMPVDLDAAFALKDLGSSPMVMRSFRSSEENREEKRSMDRKSSLRIGSKLLQMEAEELESKEEERSMDRKSSVGVGSKLLQMEAEELESKLEKWRIELSPEHGMSRSGSKRRRSRTMSCFWGSDVGVTD